MGPVWPRLRSTSMAWAAAWPAPTMTIRACIVMIHPSCNVWRRRTMMTAPRVWYFLLVLLCVTGISAGAEIPETTHKVVYEKTDGGYRLQLVEAPVPKPGAGQVLVRMRAVALNRGEIENLAQGGRDRSGMIAASDGAG